jgi:hypothetical protein
VKRPIAGYVFAVLIVTMVFVAVVVAGYCYGRQP